MNKCFITGRLIKRYDIHFEDSSDFILKMIVKVPTFNKATTFYSIEACSESHLAKTISQYYYEGDILLLEGLILTNTEIHNNQKRKNLCLFVTNAQSTF